MKSKICPVVTLNPSVLNNATGTGTKTDPLVIQ